MRLAIPSLLVWSMVMDDRERIKDALDRSAKAVALRPGVGQGTARATARVTDGLRCDVTEGPWTLSAALPDTYGGDGGAPTPGVLGRSALASCVALGYAMWAARMDLPIDELTVEVEADYDARGELGVDDGIAPGYTQVRYTVSVVSSASEERVREVLDVADRYSSYRDVFARANDVRRELHVRSLDVT
jgi:uncharacterized OsmC-like protein